VNLLPETTGEALAQLARHADAIRSRADRSLSHFKPAKRPRSILATRELKGSAGPATAGAGQARDLWDVITDRRAARELLLVRAARRVGSVESGARHPGPAIS
jgi:hypothetical protein